MQGFLSRLLRAWNERFASREWQIHGDAASGTWRERRWTAAGWEYRDLTPEELNRAEWWWATR